MNIPTDELVNDWYAARLDVLCCEKLGPDELAERLEGNKKVMAVIEAELEKRGELGRIRRS